MDVLAAMYTQAFITLVVGSVAIWLYGKQKSDYKMDAARSILLEIQSGERVVLKIRDALRNENLDIDVSLLQSESWSKTKHLFVRDFDQDEWESISDFYNKAALIDEAIKYNKTAFANDVEQIRANKQRVFADYASEAIKDFKEGDDAKQAQELYELKAKTFDAMYMDKQDAFAYTPIKPVKDTRLYLQDFPRLTTSSVGIKLKKLSGDKK